jgi:hypothetical protein
MKYEVIEKNKTDHPFCVKVDIWKFDWEDVKRLREMIA